MVLEERGRAFLRHDALDRPPRNGRLVLAERDDLDATRSEDCGEAHRDRSPRHVALAEEIRRRVDARDAVKRDQSRHAAPRGPAAIPPRDEPSDAFA